MIYSIIAFVGAFGFLLMLDIVTIHALSPFTTNETVHSVINPFVIVGAILVGIVVFFSLIKEPTRVCYCAWCIENGSCEL